MFTGIIQRLGRIEGIARVAGGARIRVASGPWDPPLSHGESVAVQGICLTVAEVDAKGFSCDVLNETMQRTAFKEASTGLEVNLERALALGDLLGGHLVSGHVDGKGSVSMLRKQGNDWLLQVQCDQTLIEGMVPKGSVTCDGVSLTISRLDREFFEVCLIPVTWSDTALHRLTIGDPVNIETDMLGKYVSRYLQARFEQRRKSPVTMELLHNSGFQG